MDTVKTPYEWNQSTLYKHGVTTATNALSILQPEKHGTLMLTDNLVLLTGAIEQKHI